jgi:hypothetical protein
LLGIKLPALEKPAETHFEVFKENMPAIEAFLMLDGCAWQYTGLGEMIGLDYKAADVIWNRADVTLDAESFRGVMLFSRTVVTELKKQRKK